MELYPKTKGANGFSNGCGMTAPVNKKKGKCIRGKDTEQRNGYGLQAKGSIKKYSNNLRWIAKRNTRYYKVVYLIFPKGYNNKNCTAQNKWIKKEQILPFIKLLIQMG